MGTLESIEAAYGSVAEYNRSMDENDYYEDTEESRYNEIISCLPDYFKDKFLVAVEKEKAVDNGDGNGIHTEKYTSSIQQYYLKDNGWVSESKYEKIKQSAIDSGRYATAADFNADNLQMVNASYIDGYGVYGEGDMPVEVYDLLSEKTYGIKSNYTHLKSYYEREWAFDLYQQRLDKKAMNDYGYHYDGMRPIMSTEDALAAYDIGENVFLLYPDNTEGEAQSREDIENFNGIFGIEIEQSPIDLNQSDTRK